MRFWTKYRELCGVAGIVWFCERTMRFVLLKYCCKRNEDCKSWRNGNDICSKHELCGFAHKLSFIITRETMRFVLLKYCCRNERGTKKRHIRATIFAVSTNCVVRSQNYAIPATLCDSWYDFKTVWFVWTLRLVLRRLEALAWTYNLRNAIEVPLGCLRWQLKQ